MRINKVLEKIKTSDDTEDIVIASMNLDDEAKKLSIIEELNHKDEDQLKDKIIDCNYLLFNVPLCYF